MALARSALIVANGDLPPDAVLGPALDAADFILAADGGANGLMARGVIPDAVLGDFDSLTTSLPDSVRRVHAPDQNFTDLDKAVQYIRSEGFASAVIAGATGSRLDHTFGALSVLVKHGRSLPLILLDGIGTARLVVNDMTLETQADQIISLLALGRADGIVTRGLQWELRGESLAVGDRDGISNIATNERVRVQVASGNLIVYLHHALQRTPSYPPP